MKEKDFIESSIWQDLKLAKDHVESIENIDSTWSVEEKRSMLESLDTLSMFREMSKPVYIDNQAFSNAVIQAGTVKRDAKTFSSSPSSNTYNTLLSSMKTLFSYVNSALTLSVLVSITGNEAIKDRYHKSFVEDIEIRDHKLNNLDEKLSKALLQLESFEENSNILKSQLSDIQNDNTNHIETRFSDINQILDESKKNLLERIESANELIKEESEKAKKFFNDKIEEIAELQQVTAGIHSSNQYNQQYNKERKFGYITYAIGGLFIVAAAVFFIWFSFILAGEDTDILRSLISKLTVGTVLSAAGAVSIRMGTQAFYRANEYKRQQLEILTLPILTQISQDANEESISANIKARNDFLTKSFGRTWDGSHKGSSTEDALGADALLKILELVLRENIKNEEKAK